MEFFVDIFQCIFLERSIAHDSVFIEVFFPLFLIELIRVRLVDEFVRKQTLVVKANLIILFLTVTPEYFPAPNVIVISFCDKSRDSKRVCASLFPSIKVTLFFFSAHQFTSLHVPHIDFVVVAECLELIIHLRSEYIFLTRLHFLERKQVLVKERNDLQSTIYTLHEDNILVLLTVNDQIVAADYSIGNRSLKWSLSNVFENDLEVHVSHAISRV